MRLRRRESGGHLVDSVLAGCFLVVGEVELYLDTRRTNPLVLDALAVAALTLALLWRRRMPLVVAIVAAGAALCLVVHGDIDSLTIPMVVLFVPPYSVARYASWRRAIAGLLVVALVPLVLAVTSPTQSGLIFSLGAVLTSWAVGRALRASAERAEALRGATRRTEIEREERQRRAVVGERARIAVELQAVVVDSVSDMVLQAETADRFLIASPAAADACMASVQDLAHQVLDDMRRVLGILRDPDRPFDLAPLPGVADLGSLRGVDGRELALDVRGSGPALPASLELALYRIVQSGLDSATERPPSEPLAVTIHLSATRVEVELSVADRVCVGWPTVSMREWVGLCDGQIRFVATGGSGERLTVAIPQPVGVYA